MPFEEKRIFVREKDVICKKKKKKLLLLFFFTKKMLFVLEKDVTIFGNDVTITL